MPMAKQPAASRVAWPNAEPTLGHGDAYSLPPSPSHKGDVILDQFADLSSLQEKDKDVIRCSRRSPSPKLGHMQSRNKARSKVREERQTADETTDQEEGALETKPDRRRRGSKHTLSRLAEEQDQEIKKEGKSYSVSQSHSPSAAQKSTTDDLPHRDARTPNLFTKRDNMESVYDQFSNMGFGSHPLGTRPPPPGDGHTAYHYPYSYPNPNAYPYQNPSFHYPHSYPQPQGHQGYGLPPQSHARRQDIDKTTPSFFHQIFAHHASSRSPMTLNIGSGNMDRSEPGNNSMPTFFTQTFADHPSSASPMTLNIGGGSLVGNNVGEHSKIRQHVAIVGNTIGRGAEIG